MNQLQFLKIEQNPIVFPPSEIVDFPGEDMEGWLSSLKSFLVAHKSKHRAKLAALPFFFFCSRAILSMDAEINMGLSII